MTRPHATRPGIAPRALPRRRFLQGTAGLAVALPWLEKLEGAAQAQMTGAGPKRVIVMTYQMGIPGGVWRPSAVGGTFTLPYVTAPLERFKSRCLFVSAIDNRVLSAGGNNFVYGHPAKTEAALTGTLTTGAFPTENSNRLTDVLPSATTMGGANGPSIEYLIGRALPGTSAFPSVDLGIDGDAPVRPPPAQMPSRFFFEGPGNAISLQLQPHLAFARLFAGITGSAPSASDVELRKLRLRNKSVLDAVRGSFTDLRQGLGVADQRRLDDHAARIRHIELAPVVTASCAAPAGVSAAMNYRGMKMNELSAMQIQILAHAMACNLAPVGRIEYGNQQGPRFGIPSLDSFLDGLRGQTDWHGVVHGDPLPGTTAFLRPGRDQVVTTYDQRLQDGYRFFVQQFAELLAALDAIPEGQGTTVLDNSLLILASDLGEGLGHGSFKMGYILAGNLGGARHGFHFDAGPSAPYEPGGGYYYQDARFNVSQLLNSILDMAGVKDAQGQPASMGLGGWLASRGLPRRIDGLFV